MLGEIGNRDGLFERKAFIMNFFRYQIGKTLARIALIIAFFAIRISGEGMAKVEVASKPTYMDWECVGGFTVLVSIATLFLSIMILT